MFYLKYRPQKIAEIDNQERREFFSKLFSRGGAVPHAFLFIGPRGTGKTSTARIIAKILNCQNNTLGSDQEKLEPCLQCPNCLSIKKGNFLDVVEMDAASNRGIDDIRALRDQINFTPTSGKYKVYIIDEVHMLTKEAFNALLKTLEEPPEFVVFILATTEAHKLPATISSRCVVVNFQRASEEELVFSLQRIIRNEKIELPTTVLQRLAKKSTGSFRDAAKALETLIATTDLSPKTIDAYFRHNLSAQATDFLAMLLAGKEKESWDCLFQFEQQGVEAIWLIEEWLNELTGELIKNKTNQLKAGSISRTIKLLLTAYTQSKYCPNEYLPLYLLLTDYFSSSK
jgi:DNA polymerase-3 subunit gamma/tau